MSDQRTDANRGEPTRCPICSSHDNFHPLWCGQVESLSEMVRAMEARVTALEALNTTHKC